MQKPPPARRLCTGSDFVKEVDIEHQVEAPSGAEEESLHGGGISGTSSSSDTATSSSASDDDAPTWVGMLMTTVLSQLKVQIQKEQVPLTKSNLSLPAGVALY